MFGGALKNRSIVWMTFVSKAILQSGLLSFTFFYPFVKVVGRREARI